MQNLQLIEGRTQREVGVTRPKTLSVGKKLHVSAQRTSFTISATASRGLVRDDLRWPDGKGEFFRSLSDAARRDFDTLANRIQCHAADVLIAEEQRPLTILFLLEGEVNISMNSIDGKRFLLGVAKAGEVLGLASAISGGPSEIRAEARFTCKIAAIPRHDFLDFLLHHPVAAQNVARELSLVCRRLSERLRILGLTTSVPVRLACLLLNWCKDGQLTRKGTRIRCTLTQAEIGECIGSSRETITRTLTELKNLGLLCLSGSTLLVPSRTALAIFAGIDSPQDPNEPAA